MSISQNSFLYSNMEPLKPVETTTSQIECSNNPQEVILIFSAESGNNTANNKVNDGINGNLDGSSPIGNNNNNTIILNCNPAEDGNRDILRTSSETGLIEETISNNSNDDSNASRNGNSKTLTRFKWTKEKSQVAMNLVKHGCKPKLVSVAVGCSLRTAQKFVETVTPKIEGESFRNYEIRRRGRKSKDVNQRLEAIREVLSKDDSKTQVEIAADLKVSNTTVCRDLKRIGTPWKKKRKRGINMNSENSDNIGNLSDCSPGACLQGSNIDS